jgi:hypothetical protein
MSVSRHLNRDPKYATGEYTKMFEIDEHQSNQHFVKNPYQPGKCQCGDMVCFSLTNGALACRPDKTKMLVYSSEGKLVSAPLKH